MNTDDIDPCEVCSKEQAATLPSNFDGIHQKCPRCGEFKLSGTAGSVIRRFSPEKRALVSGWVRDQNNSGAIPMITTHVLDTVLQRSAPPISERATALLREAVRGQTGLGARFNINDSRFLAASYSSEKNDVIFLGRMLEEQGFMAFRALGGECEILPRGYMALEELRGKQASSEYGFIAMWFDESMNSAFEDGLQRGVLGAGYNPLRIDRVEHINRIDDEIIRQINRSRFVVADFTGHRGGVYFEAGYALGKDIPVFWSCRKSDMDELHFDIRQFNCIDWETPADLSSRLSVRIEAVLGPGSAKVGVEK